jgi:hypothetical protein
MNKKITGWVIIHKSGPNMGWYEMDYFDRKDFSSHKIEGEFEKGSDAEREAWRKTFRPDCEIKKAEIVIL